MGNSIKIGRQPLRMRAKTPKSANPTEYDWGRSTITEGKGKKDGNCNRTACQMPLAGQEQWYMRDHGTVNGRLYYCTRCADDFTKWDIQSGAARRCQIDPDTRIPR